MSEPKTYSARAVFDGMKGTLHRYLEAQYHIWDEGLVASNFENLGSKELPDGWTNLFNVS